MVATWMGSVGWRLASLLAFCPIVGGTAARAEYHLDAGDVLEISIAGAPELQRRVSIGLDGNISFPVLGTVAVAGLEPALAQREEELRALEAQLATLDERSQHVANLEAALSAATADAVDLRRSMSWRVTAPLRTVYGWWLKWTGA